MDSGRRWAAFATCYTCGWKNECGAMLNITPDHLVNAVPTALFGIFGLWAAASTRHWFLRTAVVAGALLVLLLIPAYDVLIQFGCVVLFLVVSLAIWRKARSFLDDDGEDAPAASSRIPSLSLASLLLFVVVVAVVSSVAARVPDWPFHHWVDLVGTGLMAGAVGIACVWIVCGRAPWWLRLMAIPVLLFGFALAFY